MRISDLVDVFRDRAKLARHFHDDAAAARAVAYEQAAELLAESMQEMERQHQLATGGAK